MTRERRIGFDLELRWGDFFLSIEYLPSSDVEARSDANCSAAQCDPTAYPYSGFHRSPGTGQTMVGLGLVWSAGWGL